MKGNVLSRKTRKTSLMVIIVLLALLSTTTAAFATYRVINLNDNTVDSQWQASPIYTGACNKGSVNDRDEVRNAWITNSDPTAADQGWYYFRIETCTGPALSSTSNYAAVQVDCNGDGDFIDPGDLAGDRKIAFTQGPSGDQYYVLDGGGTVMAAGSDPGDPPFNCSLPATTYHGERPGGTASSATSVEWGFQFCDLPPGCRGATTNNWPISMQIGTATSTGTSIDGSGIISYSTPPTAVTLNSLTASSPDWQNPLPLFVVSIISAVFALGLFFLRQKIGTE